MMRANMNTNDIARARSAIPFLSQTLYLNTGTSGLSAQPVVEKLLELTRYSELGGLPAYYEVSQQAIQARNRLAKFLGAADDELAFTWNASHSLNVAMWLRWDAMRTAADKPVDVLAAWAAAHPGVEMAADVGWTPTLFMPMDAAADVAAKVRAGAGKR